MVSKLDVFVKMELEAYCRVKGPDSMLALDSEFWLSCLMMSFACCLTSASSVSA